MRSLFGESDLAAIEQVMRVNFFGTLYPTYYAIPHVKQTRGSLVAISSLTGKRGIPSYSIYGASKFAVQGLYESLRIELAGDGVNVGVVSPGFVDTPLRQRVLGPDGHPWKSPPPPPFRVWPVEKCVDCIMKVLLQRRWQGAVAVVRRSAPRSGSGVGGWLGDRYLGRKFRRNAQLFAKTRTRRADPDNPMSNAAWDIVVVGAGPPG